MAVLNGTLYVVSVDGDVIGAAKNASLTIDVDMPDATHKGSGGWAAHLAGGGLRSWKGSFDGFYDPFQTYTVKDITDAIIARADVAIVFEHSSQLAGTLSFSGTATFGSFQMSAELENAMTWSGSFTGNGALTITELT